jgi:hypothetical protein
LLLAFFLHYPMLSKLHLLWLAPTAFPIATLLSMWTARRGTSWLVNSSRPIPPGLITMLILYFVALSYLAGGTHSI